MNIFRVWDDKNLITNSDIINGFKYAGIIGNSYLTNEQQRINSGYVYDIIGIDINPIFDDLGEELNLNDNDIENIINNEEEAEDEDGSEDKIEELNDAYNKTNANNDFMVLESGVNSISNSFISKNLIYNSNEIKENVEENNKIVKEQINHINNIFNFESINNFKNEFEDIEKMDLDD